MNRYVFSARLMSPTLVNCLPRQSAIVKAE